MKEAIEVAVAMAHVSAAPFPGLLIDEKFIYDDINKIVGKKGRYYELGGLSNEGGFKNTETVVFFPIIVKDNIYSVVKADSKCETFPINIMWDGEKISSTFQYELEFDESRKVIAVKDKGWGKMGKVWIQDVVDLKYDHLGRLVNIENKQNIGKGKNSSDVSVKYTSLYTTKTIEYLDQHMAKVVVTSYAKGNGKAPQEIKYVRTIIINESDNELKVEEIEEGNIVRIKMIMYEGDQIVSNKVINQKLNTYKMATFKYNDLGFVEKGIYKDHNANDELTSHSEREYEYSLKEKEQRGLRLACKYEVKPKTYVYDLEGNVKREIVDSKFRDKLTDGSWTNWKFFTY